MPVWIECKLANSGGKLIYVNLSQVISMRAEGQGIMIFGSDGETIFVEGSDPKALISQGVVTRA